MENQPKLTLYNAECSKEWDSDFAEALDNPDRVFQRIRYGLRTWRKGDLRKVHDQLYYADVSEISSIFLGPSRHGIGFNPKRLYFKKGECEVPIQEIEFKILKGKNRPDTAPAALLKTVLATANELRQKELIKPYSLVKRDSDDNVLKSALAMGSNGECFHLGLDLWRGLKTTKAYHIPDDFKIVLVHDENQDLSIVKSYQKWLIEWLPELGVQKADQRVLKWRLENTLRKDHGALTVDGLVFLVAISGKPGDPLPEQQSEFISLLERLKLQFRVFSYDNKDPQWSTRSQAVSILQAAGGEPYRLVPPVTDLLSEYFVYGVDLGHNVKTGISNLVVSVTDQYGRHLVSVRKRQKLNEATNGITLEKMLVKVKQLAIGITGRDPKASIVLRDGLIPSKRGGSGAEDLRTYLDALGPDTSVVEYRKSYNPEMYIGDHSSARSAPAGSVCHPSGSAVRFVEAYEANQGLARVTKIHVPEGGDGLQIGLDPLCKIIVSLCYSPSLGLKPHLAGPIYWANGIARTRKDSYQFSGQPVHDLDD
jgi:hypothetical protein